jgi:predicted alpha/beta-fold hydrolase
MYSGSKTSDARCALLFLRSRYPDSPMFGLGFSLGANIMAKLLGEDGAAAQLWGALVCAPPTDMVAGSACLEDGGALRGVYSRKMCGNLSRLAARHADTLALHAPLQVPLRTLLGTQSEEVKAAAKARGIKAGSLKWVDDILTRHVGGHQAPYGPFPFAHADDYYAEAGAINHLKGVARPLLVLNADDDPIVAPESVRAVREAMGLDEQQHETAEKGNGFIALVTT